MKRAVQCLAKFGSSYPYTMMGKKVIHSIMGERVTSDKFAISDKVNRAKGDELETRMKTGRNVALIGFSCPIFWISLFFGALAGELYLNAAHSGIVVVIGLGLMLKAKRDFNTKH